MPDEIQTASGKTTGFLKKKIGPLEVWQVGVGVVGLVLAYAAYRNHAANAAGGPSSAPATATTLPPGGAQPTSAETTLSGQLTDLTGQVGALQQSVAALTPNQGGASTTVQTSSSTAGGDVANLFGLLGRAPSTGDTAYWQQYENSNGLYQSIAAVGASPEAANYAAGNPSAFVTAEYKAANLTPDAGGLAYWQGYLQTNGAAQESAAFANSAKAAPHA